LARSYQAPQRQSLKQTSALLKSLKANTIRMRHGTSLHSFIAMTRERFAASWQLTYVTEKNVDPLHALMNALLFATRTEYEVHMEKLTRRLKSITHSISIRQLCAVVSDTVTITQCWWMLMHGVLYGLSVFHLCAFFCAAKAVFSRYV